VLGGGVQFDAAVVGFQDGCGDRQAETGATTVVHTVRISAVEPVEHAGGVVEGDAGTLVVYLQRASSPSGRSRSPAAATGGSCAAGGRWGRTVNCTGVPAGVWISALVTRLVTT